MYRTRSIANIICQNFFILFPPFCSFQIDLDLLTLRCFGAFLAERFASFFGLPGKIKSAVYVVHSTGIAPYANKALSATENPLKNGRFYRIMNRRYEQGEYYDYSSTCFGLGAAFTLANLSVLVTPGGCRNILFSSGGRESHSSCTFWGTALIFLSNTNQTTYLIINGKKT